MPELTQFESTKSMMRNLPPNGVAGLQRMIGQVLEALAAAAGHDDRERMARDAADVAAHRRLPGIDGAPAFRACERWLFLACQELSYPVQPDRPGPPW